MQASKAPPSPLQIHSSPKDKLQFISKSQVTIYLQRTSYNASAKDKLQCRWICNLSTLQCCTWMYPSTSKLRHINFKKNTEIFKLVAQSLKWQGILCAKYLLHIKHQWKSKYVRILAFKFSPRLWHEKCKLWDVLWADPRFAVPSNCTAGG